MLSYKCIGFPRWLNVKNLSAMQEMQVWSLGWEDTLDKENGNPLQCSCLGNPMDRGAWQVVVYKATKSQTRLND